MNKKFNHLIQAFTLVLAIGSLHINHALADNVRLVDKPLVDSSTSDVLPNLTFILDNSGSMNFNYTPDWANSGTNRLFRNSAYNTQYYNPSISYVPASTFSGASMASYTNPASVRTDGFFATTNYTMESHLGDANTDTLVDLRNNAEYFYYTAGEHCTTPALTTCVASTTPTATHPFPAQLRWCNSSGAANTSLPAMPAAGACRAVREGSFTNLRTPQSRYTIVFPSVLSTVSSIKINGIEIMSANASTSLLSITNVRNRINDCTSSITGNCTISGHSASSSALTLTIISPAGAPINPLAPVQVTLTGVAVPISTHDLTYNARRPGSLVYTDIVSGNNSYTLPGSSTKDPDRTDCAGSICNYAEEMTNYSNWYAYYRTRMQGMKTSASLAFKPIDTRYRVGFITINNSSSNYLAVNKFELGAGQQKNQWYTRLFSAVPGSGTPLRQALSTVGRIYAKKSVGFTAGDPVEYACQPNFALLTTDGYWNGAAGVDLNGSAIGNLDGGSTPRPLYEGGSASSNSLADVSKYYYDNDLRTSAQANCTGALGQNVCGEGAGNESIAKQNLTTLTLGLGIDGTLVYSNDYKTQTIGDFADIKTGAKNWPRPAITANPDASEDATHIDDLWHAAVNANGTYFSARTPKELSDSLRKALSDIQSKIGAGSAASASSLQPTAGDNFNYVASYATVKWTGNVEARTVNLQTLQTSEDAVWCAENVAADSCAAPASIVADPSNGRFFCTTPNSTAANCDSLGGVLDITTNPAVPTCKVEVATSCTGTMATRVSASSDTRKIYFNASGALADFNYGNLSSAQKGFFEATYLSTRLSQWPEFTTGSGSQQEKAVGNGIVNYLRGQQGFEERASNVAENRLFRYREATLGDITESQPAYIAKPTFNYTDAGYSTFKAGLAGRQGMIYVGANDGMLHAFNANTGQEVWAFIPTPVIPNMWKLADRDYATSHRNFVNGDPLITDVCTAGCTSESAVWKTVLIGGLNGGGRGYYALDITNPGTPTLMWEFGTQQTNNLGYTFGSPVVTKLNDGSWVVLITTGYNNGSKDNDGVTNNVPSGDGQGRLYVLNPANGAIIKTISTGVGTPTTPSGLAQIAGFAENSAKNNLATFVYGGDLQGNLWRFDINAGSALRIASLVGPSGLAQPITTAPQLGTINKKRVIFVGTGKYLEVADLTNTERQTLYAIKDADLSSTLGNPRPLLVEQTINQSGSERTASNVAVDFNAGLGWRVDFPDNGERVNIDPFLVNGVLLAPTVVPASSSCAPGGYGWFNFFNYKTGAALPIAGGIVSEKLNAPAVGFNVLYKDGKPVISVVQANDPTPKPLENSEIGQGTGSIRTNIFDRNPDNTYGRKSIWRELVPNSGNN